MLRLLLFFTVILYNGHNLADIDNLRLTRLSTNEGLSQSSVNSLLIDREGFLWLATDGGLNHFDGYAVKHLSGPDNIFADAPISYLYQDSTGLIWISTPYSGLYTLDPKKLLFTQIREYNSLLAPEIEQMANHIVEDQAHNFWIAFSQELLLYDPTTGKTEIVFDLAQQSTEAHIIRRLLVQDNIIYIATSMGFFAMDLQTRKWKEISIIKTKTIKEDQKNTKELYLQENGILWIGTVEGLYTINTKNIAQYISDDKPQPLSTQWEKFRNIWRILPITTGILVATDDGLYNLQFSNNSFQRLFNYSSSKYEVSDNNIWDMVSDNQGNYWLASVTAGAFHWNPQSVNFKNISQAGGTANPLSNDMVWSLHESADDTLWIGTNNGLNQLNLKNNSLDSFLISDDKKALFSSGTINQIVENDADSLWLLTGDGLKLFDKATGQTKTLFLKNANDLEIFKKSIWGISMDHVGKLWFMSDQGFNIYDPKAGTIDKLESLNDSMDVQLSYYFLGSLPGKPETMLISSVDQLSVYNQESKQLKTIYHIPDSKLQTYITPDNWLIDKNNILWITFPGHGLIGVDAESYEVKYKYNKNNKLPTNAIYGIHRDKEDDFWLSSHVGLLKLDGTSHHLQQFTYDDGLKENEFNGGAYTQLKDGRMVYGSMKGITLFNPQHFKTNQAEDNKSTTHITDVSLLSRTMLQNVHDLNGESILLNHDDVGLKINFSTLRFNNQDSTSYEINLKGSEDIDYPLTRENYIMFPKLSPGDYIFSVKAILPDTGQKTPAAQLKLTVQYAPLSSPIAYSIYLLLTLLSLSTWMYRRRQQQQKLMRAHKIILESEERLQLALKGSNSGEWDWNSHDNLIFENRIRKDLGHKNLPHPLPFKQHVALIHADDKKTYEKSWHRFISNPNENFECTYRLLTDNNSWQWYLDLGRVVSRSGNKSPERVAGTYTNITTTRGTEAKAKLFGAAFKQTRDWVIILDKKAKPIATNQSFDEYLDLPKNVTIKSLTKALGVNNCKRRYYKHIFENLDIDEHWQGEELILNKVGNRIPSLIKVTAISEDGIYVENFVVVITDISEQKKAEEKLRALANYDYLTGLPNRNLLYERIEHAIENANRYDNKMAVFFIDLDRFKQINDSLGHDVGDSVLIKVAQRLSRIFRKNDTVARLGGDEFVVLLEAYQSLDDVIHVAQKIITDVDEPIQLGSTQIRLSPSIGISLYPNDSKNSADLIKFSDVAMYHSKDIGGRNFHFFNESMNLHAQKRLTLENTLKQAHLDNEFINYYQPIIDANTDQIVGFELLLRWQSAEGMVSPADFIPIAEEIGLIIPMTKVALNQGLIDLKQWQTTEPTLYLSVNLATRHLEQISLVDDVRQALKKHDISASGLRFEITEGSLMKDHEKSILTMNKLNEIGVELLLDDFGTGYSSLQYLKQFPINIIKIDRSFIKDIGINDNNEAIIEAILLMAKSLNKHCIAEGVESKEQLDFMLSHGCNLIQGFLYSKPIPVQEVHQLLADNKKA